MKKQHLLISLLFSIQFLFSQTIDVGRTAGQLDVSLTGAATYNVPISVPPGIKDVVPQIGLSYSSQAGNGLAGWGWNITGLSGISRIPATMYHDGFIDPVDFDLDDRYALDGQRLLLVSGTYGAPNSVYQTENYSNIKVKAYGVHTSGANYGPKYFVVYYPNGNRGYYGKSNNSRGKLQWAIYDWRDPQQNVILYYYNHVNGLLQISSIRYGFKAGTTNTDNRIRFHYSNRERAEQAFVGGHSFLNDKILTSITIKIRTNGQNKLLREYRIKHEATSLGYEKLTEIQEFNGEGHAFEPIEFTYDNTPTGIQNDINVGEITCINENDFSSLRHFSGDFNDDGHNDIVLYKKMTIKYFYIKTDYKIHI